MRAASEERELSVRESSERARNECAFRRTTAFPACAFKFLRMRPEDADIRTPESALRTDKLITSPGLENFISDFHTKVSHAISNKHINNCEDKDFLFISAGPSFMNDLNDIL